MKEMRKKLGDYITQRREKNTSDDLPICGVCREGLIPPKQQDADISLYNVFYKNDFIFNPARMELNSITLNTQHDKAICSSLYEIFYINDTSILLPEFLFVQLKTDNFIRFCEFQGQGSVREYCRFANISEYPVIVPNIKEQQKIVDTYNAITNRIRIKQKINENLEKTAQAIYKKMFIENADENWEKRKLGTLIEIKRGGSPRPIQNYIQPSGFRWLKISDATASKSPYIFKTEEYISEDGLNKTVLLKAGSLILSNSATPGLPKILRVDSCIHDGWLYFPKSKFSNEYLYLLFQDIREDLKSRGNGSIFTNLKTDILKEYFVYVPDDSSLSSFQDKIEKLFYQILKNSEELNELEKVKQLVVSQISKR